ncbi:MAG: hypothetical protein ACO3UU_17445 [Minisyncoccia bacterium]
MMNTAIKTIIISIIITIIISTGFGFALAKNLGFWQGTVLAFLTQIILFYVYSLVRQNKTEKLEEEHFAIISEIEQRSLIDVVCPCGVRGDQIAYFDLEDATFTCEKCSSKFRVEVVFNPVLLTEPLNLENAFNKIKEKELL